MTTHIGNIRTHTLIGNMQAYYTYMSGTDNANKYHDTIKNRENERREREKENEKPEIKWKERERMRAWQDGHM